MAGEVELAFSIGSAHLKGAVSESEMPDDVKATVVELLDNKSVDEAAAQRVRDHAPARLNSVLAGVATGASVEEAVGDDSAVDLLRSLHPKLTERWQDFSAHAAVVEANIEAFVIAFNQRNAAALVATVAFPFTLDRDRFADGAALEKELAGVWKEKDDSGRVGVQLHDFTHMPTEAFYNADKIAELELPEKLHGQVRKVLDGKPGYVTLCKASVVGDDGDVSDADYLLLVSRQFRGKYRIVWLAE